MTDEELMKRLLDFEKVTVGDARDAALRIKALTAKLAQAMWLLTEAAVQLEEGKIKTRKNRAAIIWNLLDEMKDEIEGENG